MHDIDWKKYGLVFFITATIFLIAFFVSTLFYNKRLDEFGAIENRVSLNFLALEIEADLLSELSCDEEYVSLTVSDLEALGDRLSYLESKNTDKETIHALKTQYSLFELKDYLFLKQLKARCGEDLHFIFYFYSNEATDCKECDKQGYVLEKIRKEHPSVRVYSFDYNLEIPGINTLKRFYGLKKELPIVVVDRQVLYGFQDENAILSPMGLKSSRKEITN
ncbi:MAG: hypothetical protein AAB727_01765 [Patescibacteria group bacterium]